MKAAKWFPEVQAPAPSPKGQQFWCAVKGHMAPQLGSSMRVVLGKRCRVCLRCAMVKDMEDDTRPRQVR